jgi:peptidoglycan/xylan/chitin deacetylase (PgdA/CDA1 family)
MVGEAAQAEPALVRQVAEAGHAIGNHSWDHASLPCLSGPEQRAQLLDCQRALAPYGSRWFRPPFGHHTPGIHWLARRLGFDVVGWSRTGKDWMGLEAQAIVGLLLERLQPGHVILLHDRLYTFEDARVLDRRPTLEVVQTLLGHFEGRLQFVSLPELLRHGRPWRQLWHRPVDLAYLNRVQTACGSPRRYDRPPRPSALERALLDRGIGR